MARSLPLSALMVFSAVVTSCSAPREIAPPPAPVPPRVVTPPPPPPPPAPANWEDRMATPGNWMYRADARGSVALFGPFGTDALFVMRCDTSARKIYLSRAGSRAADDAVGAMTIRASGGVRSLPTADTGATPPYMAAALTPTDPHLDAMVFSRGKFMVSVKGQPDLILPAWGEITRVVEDCRS